MRIGRRAVLQAGLVGSGALLVGCEADASDAPEGPLFRHGVASFDPGPDRVLLSTHLSGVEGDVPVTLIAARDAGLSDVIVEAPLTARAAEGHVVTLELVGLAPGTTVFYAFEARGERSRTGRTRTTPASGPVRLAFASCASYAHGFFHAYARLAEEDVDAVVHLGDYVYEYANGVYGARRDYDPPHEVLTLTDYRRRYAHYRADADLAALHARHPFVVTWDDHELANNAWRGGAIEHDPRTEGPWSERLLAARIAHAEWLPTRSEGSLYRRISFGTTADLFVLDTRLEGRDAPPETLEEARAPGRSILGAAQRERFLADLRDSRATWKVVAHSVQLSPHAEFWNFDAWDGYADERRVVLEAIRDAGVTGVIVVCGDGHKSFADEVPLDPWRGYDPTTSEGAIVVELMTPAISSPNLVGAEARALEAAIRTASPHTRFVDAESRGFWTLTLDDARATATLHFVDGIEDASGGASRIAARVEITPDAARLRLLPP